MSRPKEEVYKEALRILNTTSPNLEAIRLIVNYSFNQGYSEGRADGEQSERLYPRMEGM
jgi:hypothetical protein